MALVQGGFAVDSDHMYLPWKAKKVALKNYTTKRYAEPQDGMTSEQLLRCREMSHMHSRTCRHEQAMQSGTLRAAQEPDPLGSGAA